MKKILAIVLAVLMLLTVASAAFAEESVSNDQETFPGMIETDTVRSGLEAAPKQVTDRTLKVGFCPSAVDVYYNRKREWNKLIDRAMAMDFSWNTSAREYEKLYDQMLGW